MQDNFWKEHFLSNKGLCTDAGSCCWEDDSDPGQWGQRIIRAESGWLHQAPIALGHRAKEALIFTTTLGGKSCHHWDEETQAPRGHRSHEQEVTRLRVGSQLQPSGLRPDVRPALHTWPETETNVTFHQKLEKSLPCRAMLKKKKLKKNFTQQNTSFENNLMCKSNQSRKPELDNGG